MYSDLNVLQDPEEIGLNQVSQKIHIWKDKVKNIHVKMFSYK